MEAEARLILAAAVETSDEPVDLVASIREHFSGTGIDLVMPDRKTAAQRPITFGS
jgi:plasmid stability protein